MPTLTPHHHHYHHHQPPHPIPPLALDATDSDPASSVASPSGASSCSYGSSMLPQRFEDFLSVGPGAAEVFVDKLEDLVDDTQLLHILDGQRHMLTRFEKTNEMLVNFNALSASRFDNAALDFRRHTNLLLDMKKELDGVFRRIRSLKRRLALVYPEAFKVCSDVYNMEDLLEEDEDAISLTPHAQTAAVLSDSPMAAFDLRRRRSRSFPNSSISAFSESSTSNDDHAGTSADLNVPTAHPEGDVEISDASSVVEDRFEEVDVRRRRPHSGSVARGSGGDGSGGIGGQIRSSRRVFSHEERPCSSVILVARDDKDKEDEEEEEEDARSKEKPKKVLRIRGEPDKSPPQHQQHNLRQEQQQQDESVPNIRQGSSSSFSKPVNDVSLSKMASETHRFISEGVAAAVDAVLTHASAEKMDAAPP